MDARKLKTALTFLFCLTAAQNEVAEGAQFITPNFVVQAPTSKIAKQVGQTAEKFRKQLAIEWLGKPMPQWYRPCQVSVKVGQLGAGGATTFSFDRGHVFGWNMRVQGTLERILDSVIPHEVSHTVFASYFRRPLPRWADEGAATLVEHESEKRVQELRLKQVFKSPRRIPLRRLLSMKQYPRDMQQMLVLYAEGYSLADFLVQKGGKSTFLRFLNDADRSGWDAAIARHYGIKNVDALEKTWSGWFMAGSPRLSKYRVDQLASTEKSRTSNGTIIRSQSPEDSKQELATALDGGTGELSSLTAPNPRGTPHVHKTAGWRGSKGDSSWNRSSTLGSSLRKHRPTAGRAKTLNAGWVPVIRRSMRESLSDRKRLPRTAFQKPLVWGSSRTAGKATYSSIGSRVSEERQIPRGHSPRWSEFPHARTLGDQSFQ